MLRSSNVVPGGRKEYLTACWLPHAQAAGGSTAALLREADTIQVVCIEISAVCKHNVSGCLVHALAATAMVCVGRRVPPRRAGGSPTVADSEGLGGQRCRQRRRHRRVGQHITDRLR